MGFTPPAAGTADFVKRMRSALSDPPAGSDPWFLDYFGHLSTPVGMNTYLRATAQMVELVGGVAGMDVLDAGSGFGTLSHLLASWGARKVHAVEIHAPMVETHRRIREKHFPNLTQIEHRLGDASKANVPPRSVDLIISIEAVSHYYDVTGFLDQCTRALRPGGKLFISDGNNGANEKIRRETIAFWERFENGPHGPWMWHDIKETMVERRDRFMRERFPGLDAKARAALVPATSGMGPDELTSAIESYLAEGTMPDSRYVPGSCPRDPHWGYWIEWLFEPRGLALEIANRGFDARPVPHYGGANNDFFLAVNRVLRTLPSFRFAKAYRIVATKH